MKKTTIILSFLALFVSCDYYIHKEGKVIDNETNKPIANAEISYLDGAKISQTDDKGYFEVRKIGGIRLSSSQKIRITKQGYKPFEMAITSKSKSVSYKATKQLEWHDFDKPLYPDTNNVNTFILGTSINKYSQNFSTKDTLTFFLDKKDDKREIENIKNKMKL